MKTINYLALATIAVGLTVTSCRKNDTLPSNGNTSNDIKDAERITAFFDKYAPKFETFSVDAVAGGTITLASGTTIQFPANAFVRKNGTAITGSVSVKAKDILAAKNMILANKPTTARGGQMLESFGEIIVNAVQGPDTLRFNPQLQRPAQVVVPIGTNTATGGMKDIPMWSGDTTIDVTNTGYNHDNQTVSVTTQYKMMRGVTWDQIPGSFGTAAPATTTFPLDVLGGWRNCDIFYSDTRPKTTVLGYFGDKFNTATGSYSNTHSPSLLFFKTKNTNTLVNFSTVIFQPAAGKEGFLSYQNSIPVGQEGTLLAITAKNGKFYAEMRDVTIPAPASGKNFVPYTFNFQEVSEAALLALITQMSTK